MYKIGIILVLARFMHRIWRWLRRERRERDAKRPVERLISGRRGAVWGGLGKWIAVG